MGRACVSQRVVRRDRGDARAFSRAPCAWCRHAGEDPEIEHMACSCLHAVSRAHVCVPAFIVSSLVQLACANVPTVARTHACTHTLAARTQSWRGGGTGGQAVVAPGLGAPNFAPSLGSKGGPKGAQSGRHCFRAAQSLGTGTAHAMAPARLSLCARRMRMRTCMLSAACRMCSVVAEVCSAVEHVLRCVL